MNVRGLARTRSRPLYRIWMLSDASRWRPRPDRPARSASRSSTIQPMLCRVSAYWPPGFPRPTTSFTIRIPPQRRGPSRGPDTAPGHGERPRDRSDGAQRPWYRPTGRTALAAAGRRCAPLRRGGCHAPWGWTSHRRSRTRTLIPRRPGARRWAASTAGRPDLHVVEPRTGVGALPRSCSWSPRWSRPAGARPPAARMPQARLRPPAPSRPTGPARQPHARRRRRPRPRRGPSWTSAAVPAGRRLEPPGRGAGGVAPDTAFRLTSLDGRSPSDLAARLVADPALIVHGRVRGRGDGRRSGRQRRCAPAPSTGSRSRASTAASRRPGPRRRPARSRSWRRSPATRRRRPARHRDRDHLQPVRRGSPADLEKSLHDPARPSPAASRSPAARSPSCRRTRLALGTLYTVTVRHGLPLAGTGQVAGSGRRRPLRDRRFRTVGRVRGVLPRPRGREPPGAGGDRRHRRRPRRSRGSLLDPGQGPPPRRRRMRRSRRGARSRRLRPGRA